jgi:hypothetical protein
MMSARDNSDSVPVDAGGGEFDSPAVAALPVESSGLDVQDSPPLHIEPGTINFAVLEPELRPGWSPARPDHIPEPSYWPATVALGAMLLIWGIISTPLLAIPGLILFAAALAGWIGEMRHERQQH